MPYKIEFRVKGKGYFPTDMLRYSNCVARNSEDQDSINASPSDWKGEREIELVREARNLRAVKFLAEDRWKSFGWQVIRKGKPWLIKAT